MGLEQKDKGIQTRSGEMKSVLVLAYAISPTRGSEYSVAWNYIKHMSKHCRLTVLYGTSGSHIGDFDEMTRWQEENSIENVRFVKVESSWFIRLLNYPNSNGVFVYTFYFAYRQWQKRAYKLAKRLCAECDFDLVHFVGPIGYREPGYLWKLDLPYMWGPVGGTKNYPLRLSPKMKQTTRLRYLLRNGINFIQFRLNPRLRKVVARCDLLLTATTETQQKFLSILGKDSVYLPENGITHIDKNRKPRCTEDKKKGLELIFIGRIDGGKNLVMLIDSLLKLKNPGNVHLTVVGDGPERESLMRYSEMCGLDGNVEWCGQIGRENVIDKLSMSDMLVITSIGEGNPTTIWEAMSCGVPTLTLDHCGMHDTICDECGFKVDINRKYSEITAEIASIIDRCSDNPGIIEEKRIGTERCAEKYMWDKRENILLDCYDMAISKFNAGG